MPAVTPGAGPVTTRCPRRSRILSRATDIGHELIYPATRSSVLIALVTFFLLLELAAFGRILGLFLAFIVVPALMRYLMLLLQARARGVDPDTPGIELFLLFDNAWALFPLVHVVTLGYVAYLSGSLFGTVGLFLGGGLLVAVIPASLAVLAISHSPVESMKPGAVFGVIGRCGPGYWIAPLFMLAASMATAWLRTTSVHALLLEFFAFYLLFVCFGLIGGLVRPLELDREMDLPEPLQPGDAEHAAKLEQERTAVLNHAYGFISRDNRAGGMQHIHAWLEQDPQPEAAWAWFAERMLRWENNAAALPFAQHYLARLLHNGEQVAAVKLMLRCRLVNENFKPLPEDRELALAAARASHNDELISFLR